MKLIFFYGPPAAGKLTVARELERLTGIPVFHNHLTIELVREIMPNRTAASGELVAKLRLDVIEAAAKAGLTISFTFVYAAGSDDAFVARIMEAVQDHGGEVVFVGLIAPVETIRERLPNESRQSSSKIKRWETLEPLLAEHDLFAEIRHAHHLRIDTGKVDPKTAARLVVDRFELPMKHEALIHDLYAAFNRKDIEAVVAAMTEDVEWPNSMEDVRITGKDAVRNYWTYQFSVIDPNVQPTSIEVRPDGRVAVAVDQRVRDLAGNPIAESNPIHVYEFVDGKVKRMDIE